MLTLCEITIEFYVEFWVESSPNIILQSNMERFSRIIRSTQAPVRARYMYTRASVVAGKGEVVELGELKGCVVTIDVHPGLRGRVCKVDGDVVVSMAGWLAAGPVPRAEHRHPTAAAGGEVVGVHASRMHNTPRRTLCRSWHTPWPRHRRRLPQASR